MNSTPSPIASQELAVFLRARRETLKPADVGLPPRIGSSRTPGLRREEVAALAGVSVDYLIRLEQARDVRPSAQVVRSLSGALKLSNDQTVYLYTLAGHRCPERNSRSEVPEGLAQLIIDVSPLPAMVLNHRLDILAWNGSMSALLLGLDGRPARMLNVLRMCFLDSRFEGFYGDRDEVVRGAVADLRAAWADHAHDVELADLIRELEAGSDEFTRYWQSREVSVRARGDKPMKHPIVGSLTVTFDVLNPLGDPDLRLIVYRAADEQSQQALDELARHGAQRRLRTV
ncbi:helix-turn-helix transcriptional regulator [Rhodococcus sp. G-MC3]|uniref:helix-turn-helix transcriptional regulator n=1 Tax=Rhodococcus sp. G-MC3 TaxID=3046209 RepID=UPI0024B89F2A|nr:helix-turn-helix transcriptional regulator [Rhodococcus sp. G-MC3]MDJ0395545.1 helix-turn-helix transcriptional regulator [Rhodococcus sp. G-MC3]